MTEKRIILDEYVSTLSDEDRIVAAECARQRVAAVISTEVTQNPDVFEDDDTSNNGTV